MFVIFCGAPGDREVLGVASSREKAIAFLKSAQEEREGDAWFERYWLNECPETYTCYVVDIDCDGNVVERGVVLRSGKVFNGASVNWSAKVESGVPLIRGTSDMSEERAIKYARAKLFSKLGAIREKQAEVEDD